MIIALLVSAAAMPGLGLFAQGSVPNTQQRGLGTDLSVSIPAILLVSTDQGTNRLLSLEGVMGKDAQAFNTPELRRFILEPGRMIGLGQFWAFSNIPGAYRIRIWSENGAVLVPKAGSEPDGKSDENRSIPYILFVDGMPAPWESGYFSLIASGKTQARGRAIDLGIMVGDFPGSEARPSKEKVYTDTIGFDIQAE